MSSIPTLYRHFDKNGVLLYVGVSLSAVQRQISHRSTAHWFSDVRTITLEHFNNADDMLDAESIAIRTENPLHNRDRNLNRDGSPKVRAKPTYQSSSPSGHTARILEVLVADIKCASTLMGGIKKIANDCKISVQTIVRIRSGFVPNASTMDRLVSYFKKQKRIAASTHKTEKEKI